MKLILTTALLAVSFHAEAKLFCSALFSENQFFLTELLNKKIPTAEVTAGGKQILIVQANNKTVPELKKIYEHSLGIVVNHQKDYQNDHGMLRLGDFFIDRDAPGARRNGEINTTGISWAPVQGYVDYVARSDKSYNRIEVLFDLNSTEMRTALIYQKMRRAGVVRPDFIFRGAENPNLNNRLENCGEICFSFSTGSAIHMQIRGIEQKIQSLGIENPGEFIQLPEIKSYLNKLSQYLLEAKLDARSLSPEVADNVLKPGWIAALLRSKIAKPEAIREMDAIDINWLLGYKASLDYAALLKSLGIQNSNSFSNVNSPRAKMVVIYDAKTSPEKFLSDDYESEGVFSTWRNQEVVPLQDAR
jgi:hypothetical protein